MARWSIAAGILQLLMLIARSIDTVHISSQSITHPTCSDDEYYDDDRDSCFDLCRGKKCLPHQICTERISYVGPYICGDGCFHTCTLPMYCNTETQKCTPCANICTDLNENALRQCRIHCNDNYKDIMARLTQTSPAPSTAERQSTTHPMCRSDEYYDADRDTCFDMCGESKCQTHQKCSTRFPAYTDTHRCVDLCFKPCTSPLYCNIRTADCDPCEEICHEQNDETFRQCRIFCLDVYREIVVSHTSTAAPLVSTSSESPPTSDESFSTDQILVSEPTQLSPGLVAVSVVVPVVICGVLLSVIVLCIRRQAGGTLHAEEAIPLMSSKELDQYMTLLKESYDKQIKERNEIEKKRYGNVIPLDKHQPVIINQGLEEPDRQTRRAFDDFFIWTFGSKQLTLENFLRDDGQGRPRSVLMLGGPGLGKTSICYTILDRFVKNKWVDHQYIFFLSLKGFVSMARSVSLADILFDYSKALYNRENKETLIKQVEERQKKTLIVLDGYDECDEFMTDQLDESDPTAKAKPAAILKNLVGGKMLPDAQILLTSRPFKSTNENLGLNRVVQIAGLTDESALTLLENNVNSKMNTTTLPMVFVSLLCIPINLQKFLSFVTRISSEFPSEALKFPRTKIIFHFVQMIPVLQQTLRFIDFNPITKLEMWNHPSVLDFLRNLAKLASTAFDGLGNEQILFQSHELRQCGLDEDQVKQGGLMTSFTKPTQQRYGMRHVVYFYFIHLAYLEWFGGLHIVNTTLDNIRGLIRRNRGQLDVILCFAVGLLGDKDGQEILERVHGMSSDDCLDKADKILRDIVKSNRCTRQEGGHHYALEVYYQGQFTRPHLLLPLLAPDGHELELTRIAHCNRHVVHYFLSQLIALQDGQSEQAEASNEISNIDRMMLHFAEEADFTVQDGILREVGRLKKLKYLSLDTDGEFKAAVEQPLELLTVHGDMDGDDAAHIIENSRANVLSLLSSRERIHSFSIRVQPFVKELHLQLSGASSLATNLEGTNSLLAVTGLLYNQTNAPATLRLIEKNSELQAIGLDIRTEEDEDFAELTHVITSGQKIQCIVLKFDEFKESYLDMTLDILSVMTSLREIWLAFLLSGPDDNQLATLGQMVCSHTMLNSVAVFCSQDLNISAFLNILSDNNRRLSSVYTPRCSQLGSDLVKRTTGRLVKIKSGFYYAPLVYSPFFLTSVPSHVKDALRKAYIPSAK